MATYHYRESDGISGYQEGDLLISDRGTRSRVVRTGAGLQLEPDGAGTFDPELVRAPEMRLAACGCSRRVAYRHTPSEGFSCRHGNGV